MIGDFVKLLIVGFACVGVVAVSQSLGDNFISEQAAAEATALNVKDAVADAKKAARISRETIHIYDVDEAEECIKTDCKPIYYR